MGGIDRALPSAATSQVGSLFDATSADVADQQATVPIPRLMLAAIPIALATGAGAAAALIVGQVTIALGVIALATVSSVGGSVINIRKIRRMRLVDEQRRFVRFHREVAATIDGHACRVTDLSLGGARIVAEIPLTPMVGHEIALELELASGTTTLRATVRRVLERGYSSRIGVEFAPNQRESISQLAIALLHSDVMADGGSEPEVVAA